VTSEPEHVAPRSHNPMMFPTLEHIKYIGAFLFVCFLFLQTNGLKAQSIIIKFRSTDALNSPSKQVIDLTSIVARSPISAQQTFIKRSSGQTPQSVTNSFGLDRVILLPLKKGMSVDSISTLFSSFADVEYAQPNYIHHIDAVQTPNDSLFSEQWAHPNIGVQKAWDITKGDSSVKIGFIDTGVEWDHPDLVGQFAVSTKEDINGNGLFDGWKNTEEKKDARGKLVKGDLDGIDNDGNGYVDDVIGYDFVDQETLNFGDASTRDGIPVDENKHGTAVAGVIGAKENNSIGVAGIAPGCRMVALRAFDASGNAEDDDVASAIIYAADNNVKILNLSFGDIVPSLLQRDAIRYATSKGTLVFASSGNRGSNNHHYPSDFDECVSIGATTVNEDGKGDFIYSFNTHGQGMDLVAPGGSIYTTDLDGEYQVISGTSFSSPTAAAVAGLLLSKDKSLTPRSLRTILAATTHDISPTGYDNLSANGRVDAFAAVSYNGSAALKITSPHTNDGFHPGDTIFISGAAAHSLFTEYSLAFAKGLNPSDNASWQTITSSNEQKIDQELGRWVANGLSDGTYTLRLELKTTEGRSVQERINIDIHSNAPTLTFALIDTLYVNDKQGLMLRAKSDTLTAATFYYKEQTSSVWRSRKDDRYTKEHYTLLETKDATVNVPLDIRIVLRNTTADSVVYTSVAGIPNHAISQTGFEQKPYTLPLGFALDSVLTSAQGDLVTMSIFPPSSDFGPIGTFAFDKTKKLFIKTDSVNRSWVPRGIGNTASDGKPELLLQGGNNYLLYKANANDALLGDIVLYDTTELGSFFAMGLGDVDGDGKDEIVTKEKLQSGGTLSEVIRVRRRVGSTTELIVTLPNTTFPAPQYSVNNYSKADVRFADFTGDGVDDIVILDDDADLLVYKYDASIADKFVAFHTEENDAAADGSMITTGDFNADGKQDLAYTFRPSFIENRDNEYEFPFWTLAVSLGNGDGTFTKVKSEKFAYARPSSPTRSSIGSVGDVVGNGKAQIGVSLFPDFYLFEVTPSNTLQPLWHFPLSVTSRTGLSHDFDGNGRKEFAVTAGDAIYFFERGDEFANQTASPGGLEVLPRDTNEVELRWSEVVGATKYFILHAPDEQGAQFEIIDSTTLSSYHDTTVENGATYIYSVFAFDGSKSIPESQAAFGVSAFVHPKPFITNITSDGRTIRATCSQPLLKSILDGGCIRIGNIEATTVAVASDSILVITLAEALTQSGDYTLQVTNERLRDRWNSPLDSSIIPWKFEYTIPQEKFFITKWRFENPQLIHVTFNMSPSDDGLNVSRYALSPYGAVIHAYRDNTDANSLFLELDQAFQYAALGTEFILCANNITSIMNIPLTHEGDCIGTTLTEPDLVNVMVYPNPAHTKDEKMTFARLTADAEVSIYTMNQRFIRRLKTTNQKGGIEWDMRDDNGALLTSGIYLYSVTGKNDNGEEVESNQAKFVIINDK
jgi:hypothetical protein